jgi:hypothetical protein
MTAAYFEDHPTDPDKVILRKPRLDQGPDYERGFIDGMMYQTQTTVNKAVDAMSKRTWVGLTDKEILADDVLRYYFGLNGGGGPVSKSGRKIVDALETKLKEKNT